MTTKNEYLLLKNQQKSGSDNKYNNLNLNQKAKNAILIPVQSCSKSIKNKHSDSTISDNVEGKEKSQSWSKSSKFLTFNNNETDEEKKVKKLWKSSSNVINNNSTLSLHIASYENSVKAAVSNLRVENNDGSLKQENPKEFFVASIFKNPFEFPRQQRSDEAKMPEVAEYKASQRLLHPIATTGRPQPPPRRGMPIAANLEKPQLNMSSDEEYTSAEELASTPSNSPSPSPTPSLFSDNNKNPSTSTSPPSSYEVVEEPLNFQSDEGTFTDLPAEQQQEAIDEGPTSFQSRPKSNNEPKVAYLMLDDDEDEKEFVQFLDEKEDADIANLPDLPAEQQQEAIDEGPTSFQLNEIFNGNGESSKDVKLLRANFFSKPKSNNEPKVAHLMLDDDEEDKEVVECLDENEGGDIQNLPKFARQLFIDKDKAGGGKEPAWQPHERPVHTKSYARDRIHLTSNIAIRPEDKIKEGPHVNYDEEVTVRGGGNEKYPNTEVTIFDVGLLEEVQNNLKSMGIDRLKKIQQNIIPLIQNSKCDIVAYAPTGNGKTTSYLIPLVNTLVLQNRREPSSHRKPSVAILLQNHETANQVYKNALLISQGLDLQVIPATGNNNMASEVARLRHGCDMVIGTTGRFIQYVSEKKIHLDKLKYLVFDEADQFVKSREWESAMETFRHHMPPDHRTFLFSATYDDKACFSFDNFVKPNYWFIGLGELNQVEKLIRQNFLLAPGREQDTELIKLIISKAKDNRCPKTLVFTNSMDKADWLAGRLRMFQDIPKPFPIRAAALHSLIPATDRDLIFKAFTRPNKDEYSVDVIIASDKISCGVSTPAEIVINYDVPNDISTYILRVGRTGRNGHNGEAYTFINSGTMDNMPYEERKNLCCMLTLAKRTDYAPFPDALEDLHKKFTSNI